MGGRGPGRKTSAEDCGRVNIYLKLVLSQEGEECPALPCQLLLILQHRSVKE